MDKHEYREMMELVKNKKKLLAAMDEKYGIIKALKISNDERQKFINELWEEILKKDKKNISLKREIDRLNFEIDKLSIK
jgi:septal ring factor EnvC (AmiA/AmiB activator)